MAHAWKLLTNEARRKDGPDLDKFTELALTFYFYYVNFGPLSRGTAATGCFLSRPLFLPPSPPLPLPLISCYSCLCNWNWVWVSVWSLPSVAESSSDSPRCFGACSSCVWSAVEVCRSRQTHAVWRPYDMCVCALIGYIAFFALMLSIGYEVQTHPPEGTQVDWPAFLSPRPTDFAQEVHPNLCHPCASPRASSAACVALACAGWSKLLPKITSERALTFIVWALTGGRVDPSCATAVDSA